ncbi:hypothetical protein [Rahnella aceris]
MTDTTDIAALMLKMRNLADRIIDAEGENNNGEVGKIIEMYDDADTTFKAQNILLVLNALEAERQRAANYVQVAHGLAEEIAALKVKLANPVVLPAGYSTRAGHPFHEGERNVMIPNKHGDWLSRFDVEHAIHVAGFPFTVKGE